MAIGKCSILDIPRPCPQRPRPGNESTQRTTAHLQDTKQECCPACKRIQSTECIQNATEPSFVATCCNESLFHHLPLSRNTFLQFGNKVLYSVTVYLCLISPIVAEWVAASASANAISYQDWSGLKAWDQCTDGEDALSSQKFHLF